MLTKAELQQRADLYLDAIVAGERYEALANSIPETPPADLLAGSESLTDPVNMALTALLVATWSTVREALLTKERNAAADAVIRCAKFEAGEDV